MEGTLSLRLLVIAQYTPSEPFKAQESDPENIWDDSQDVTYVTKGPFSPAELLEAMQQARKERKRLRKSRQVPPRNFRVIVPIDNSNDVSIKKYGVALALAVTDIRKLAIAPENTAVIESSVAAALDTALSKLSAQRTIRKRPKPLMWNRQTVVRKKTVVGNAGSWEVDSESSGWDDPDSEVEGLDVQHNQSTWSEDSFFTQNKKLGKYRCYYKSLLRWNWKIKEVEGGNERDLAEICEEDWQFLEEYDNTSIESSATN